MFETLATGNEGAIARVTLNRPEQRNAMSARLVAELGEHLAALAADPAIRAVVLDGAGRDFCAGSDLAGLAVMDKAGREEFEAASGRLARQIWGLDLPVIAAVHGFAIGGGLTLATSCDIVLTTPQAKWSLPEVPIGLFPAWGMESVVLRVGTVKARRLGFGLDTLDGSAAQECGLAEECAEDPLARALELAGQLAEMPRVSVAAVKQWFASRGPGEAGDEDAQELFSRCSETAEAASLFARFSGKASDKES